MEEYLVCDRTVKPELKPVGGLDPMPRQSNCTNRLAGGNEFYYYSYLPAVWPSQLSWKFRGVRRGGVRGPREDGIDFCFPVPRCPRC